ncbi:hypothetical protein ACJMK2_017604 [Sinanodonta woodiana]|uniref:Uncharacterized protein n=1 Tax=Sinanodonta woodiana TaxID=1069815 RepID=A0ABD3UCW7_SINWO
MTTMSFIPFMYCFLSVPLSVSAACTRTENLNNCLTNLSSLLKYNLNNVYRIKQMCSHENKRHAHCAIEVLQKCPMLLNDTAEDFLTFLREITVDDLSTACTIWDGTSVEAKSAIEKVYVSKMTMVCIQIGPKYFDSDGKRNDCSYLDQAKRCTLENLHRTHPQYAATYKSIERAAMLFTHCVDHSNYSISEADGTLDDADAQREEDDEMKKKEELQKETMIETSDMDHSKLNGTEWCSTSENLDNSLDSISSVIQYNYNMVTRIRDMCRQETQRHAVCAIEGLKKYPERLNETAQVYLTFLREISVDDVNRVCSVWNGIAEEAKSIIGKVYVAKITNICVQMRRIPIDPNGKLNMCGYLNLNNLCAQEKLEESHPQYLESYKALEEAAMTLSHCVEHKRADVDVVPSEGSPNEVDGDLGGEGHKDSQEDKDDVSATFISLLMSGATAVASLMGWPAEKDIG